MLIIQLDFKKNSCPPTLHITRNQQNYKFKLKLMNWGKPYEIPADTKFSVWFSGASGKGNYSTINGRSAFVVDGNTITVEVSPEMVTHDGMGEFCLRLEFADGSIWGLWNIPYVVESMCGILFIS